MTVSANTKSSESTIVWLSSACPTACCRAPTVDTEILSSAKTVTGAIILINNRPMAANADSIAFAFMDLLLISFSFTIYKSILIS